jgi:hypothetical protein
VLYTLLGSLLLPWIAERQFRNILDQRLSLTGEIERLYFNPFTMNLEIEGVVVSEADGAPLLSVQRLHANFQPTRLVLLRLQFSELAVEQLDLHVARESASDNTISSLAGRGAASAEPADEEPVAVDENGGLLPLTLVRIAVAVSELAAVQGGASDR